MCQYHLPFDSLRTSQIEPAVDVTRLVAKVNEDNDFGGFVRGVRNAFKATC